VTVIWNSKTLNITDLRFPTSSLDNRANHKELAIGIVITPLRNNLFSIRVIEAQNKKKSLGNQ